MRLSRLPTQRTTRRVGHPSRGGVAESGPPVHPPTGAVILFTRNFASVEQLAQLVADIHAARQPPLLVTVDQEGGRVQRFRQPFVRLPPPRAIGRLYDEERELALKVAGACGWLIAAELRTSSGSSAR